MIRGNTFFPYLPWERHLSGMQSAFCRSPSRCTTPCAMATMLQHFFKHCKKRSTLSFKPIHIRSKKKPLLRPMIGATYCAAAFVFFVQRKRNSYSAACMSWQCRIPSTEARVSMKPFFRVGGLPGSVKHFSAYQSNVQQSSNPSVFPIILEHALRRFQSI